MRRPTSAAPDGRIRQPERREHRLWRKATSDFVSRLTDGFSNGWVFDSTNTSIPAAESIRPIVASNGRVSEAPSGRQKTYGGLGQRPEATARRKSRKGRFLACVRPHGLLRRTDETTRQQGQRVVMAIGLVGTQPASARICGSRSGKRLLFGVTRQVQYHQDAMSCRTKARLGCRVATGRTNPSLERFGSSSLLSPWATWGRSRCRLTRRRS
jgi:hypothetical protein